MASLQDFNPEAPIQLKDVLAQLTECLPAHPRQLDFVGRGGMGSVHLCVPSKQSSDTCVMKLPASDGIVAEINNANEVRNISTISATIRTMRTFAPESTLQAEALLLPWIYHTPQAFPILFMPLAGQSLHDATYLRAWNQSERVSMLREVVVDIVDGLTFLHSINRVHGDLKPANILVDRPEGACTWRGKIADFGSSVELDENRYGTARCSYHVRSPWAHARGCEAMPALVDDLWALGCVIAEVVTGAPLFRTILGCKSDEEESWRLLQQHVDFLSEGCEVKKLAVDRGLSGGSCAVVGQRGRRLTFAEINEEAAAGECCFKNDFTLQDEGRRQATRTRFLRARASDLLAAYETVVCTSPTCLSAALLCMEDSWMPLLQRDAAQDLAADNSGFESSATLRRTTKRPAILGAPRRPPKHARTSQ